MVLSATDTGYGVDPEIEERIFEPFFTTKTSQGASGLGLSIVRRVVEENGGSIELLRPPERGSCFRVQMRAEFPGEETEVPKPEGPTVLVVEDDRHVRRVTAKSLARAGYRVLEAASGEEALQVAEGTEQIDLVLSGVVMPGIGGPTLAFRMRRHRPGLRFLFMSGYADIDPASVREDFIAKPFRLAELIQRVGKALNAPSDTENNS